MPPHFTKAEPADGETLTSPVIELYGYTLDIGEDELVVQTTDGDPVPYAVDTECEWVGEGDELGSQQNKCTMTITLEKAPAGATLEIKLSKSATTVVVPTSGLPGL